MPSQTVPVYGGLKKTFLVTRAHLTHIPYWKRTKKFSKEMTTTAQGREGKGSVNGDEPQFVTYIVKHEMTETL